MPLGCADQVGRLTLSAQVAAVFPVVAECDVARFETPSCQAEPVQYWPSGRCNVKVVLLTFRPTPAELSAALPLKVAGTVAAANVLPPAGVVTDAVVGAVLSTVKVCEKLIVPSLAVTVWAPSDAPAGTLNEQVPWMFPPLLLEQLATVVPL